MPIVTGLIPGYFVSTNAGFAVEAYRWIFAEQAGQEREGDLTARDARPSVASRLS